MMTNNRQYTDILCWPIKKSCVLSRWDDWVSSMMASHILHYFEAEHFSTHIHGHCPPCIAENGRKAHCPYPIICLSENYGLWSNDTCPLHNTWCVMRCLWIQNKEKKKPMIESNRRYKNRHARKGSVLNLQEVPLVGSLIQHAGV